MGGNAGGCSEPSGEPGRKAELGADLMQERDDGGVFRLVAPCVEPDCLDGLPVLLRGHKIRSGLCRRSFCVGLLRAVGGQVPLNLLHEACLAGTPVSVDTEHLWGSTGGDGVSDIADKRHSVKAVEERGFVVMHHGIMAGGRDDNPLTTAACWKGTILAIVYDLCLE